MCDVKELQLPFHCATLCCIWIINYLDTVVNIQVLFIQTIYLFKRDISSHCESTQTQVQTWSLLTLNDELNEYTM